NSHDRTRRQTRSARRRLKKKARLKPPIDSPRQQVLRASLSKKRQGRDVRKFRLPVGAEPQREMAIELEPLRQLIVAVSRKGIQPIASRGYARSVLDRRSVRVSEKQPHAIRFNRAHSDRGHSFQ